MNNTMKNIIVAGFLSLGTVPLLAHGGIGHGEEEVQQQASESQIVEASKQYMSTLIQNNKIDASWKSTTPVQVKQQKLNDRLEWVIQYRNPQIKDPSKITLFVFVDLYGKVKAANYSGK